MADLHTVVKFRTRGLLSVQFSSFSCIFGQFWPNFAHIFWVYDWQGQNRNKGFHLNWISFSSLYFYQIPWGVPGRAYLTVPPEVEIVPSKMPNAGLGVVSTTFIPKYAWLGEYEGLTVLPREVDYISYYAWTVSTLMCAPLGC